MSTTSWLASTGVKVLYGVVAVVLVIVLLNVNSILDLLKYGTDSDYYKQFCKDERPGLLCNLPHMTQDASYTTANLNKSSSVVLSSVQAVAEYDLPRMRGLMDVYDERLLRTLDSLENAVDNLNETSESMANLLPTASLSSGPTPFPSYGQMVNAAPVPITQPTVPLPQTESPVPVSSDGGNSSRPSRRPNTQGSGPARPPTNSSKLNNPPVIPNVSF
jgi:hypothetical protein